MSVTAGEILEYIVSLNPQGKLCPEEGVLWGPADRSADAVLVCWMATVEAIREAAAEGCGIILSHEMLTFHDYFPAKAAREPWAADRARLALLKAHGITVLRAHGTVDPSHVMPHFIRTAGLTAPLELGDVWSLHDEPPIALGALARKLADALGMDAVRVTGEPGRVVRRVGVMVGGLGLDRHVDRWEKHLVGKGVEAIVAGETNDFAQRFALDAGIGLIETCHSATENPGLSALTDDLARAFPAARFLFHKCPIPWTMI
jgi:putative NIF3 family GTP cyclohydrolase 1 type 2